METNQSHKRKPTGDVSIEYVIGISNTLDACRHRLTNKVSEVTGHGIVQKGVAAVARCKSRIPMKCKGHKGWQFQRSHRDKRAVRKSKQVSRACQTSFASKHSNL